MNKQISHSLKGACLLAMVALTPGYLFAQVYQFTDVVRLPATDVKNQAATGTCWCFATTSFMESELLRMNKGTYDLSEMFIVRQKYMNQLEDNYLRQGHGNIGPGSLSHTFKHAFDQVGIVPETVYHGIAYPSEFHNHAELETYLQAVAQGAVQLKQRSDAYRNIVSNILDNYLGKLPATFTYNGKEYTPKSFAQSLGLNMDDYVEITSFNHHPFYQKFDLEVTDNWEHELIYNLPIDEMEEVMDHALENGYTVCWDGDVSEPGFRFSNGYAINPDGSKPKSAGKEDAERFDAKKKKSDKAMKENEEKPAPEINVTQAIRQEGFEKFVTTDDHLMHITGIAKDQNGTKYYITKNSWGVSRNDNKGYLNMSESYVRAKTIYIMLHKDALPAAIRTKLSID